MRRSLIIFLLFIFTVCAVFSLDFGLFLDEKMEGENNLFTYTPSAAPWLSWNGSGGTSVYFSGLLSFKHSIYKDDTADKNGWMFIPELTRTAFSYRNNRGITFEIGRVEYTDVLGFTSDGLFDGIRFGAVMPVGSISVGAYYTGFQYKETAKIIMTDADISDYVKPWDFNNFNDYFASQRVLASVRWDIPVGKANNFTFEALAQFDLNGNIQTLNSQYGALQFEVIAANRIKFTAGAIFELMQNDENDLTAAFGALAQLKANLPTSVNDQLGLKIKFTSGSMNDFFTAYTPVNSIPQSVIFSGTIAGLTTVSADYSVRFLKSLYAEFAFNYFMQTIDGSSGVNMYGGEILASLLWQPFNDVRASIAGGAFFPGIGNMSSDDSPILWKVIAGLTFSF